MVGFSLVYRNIAGRQNRFLFLSSSNFFSTTSSKNKNSKNTSRRFYGSKPLLSDLSKEEVDFILRRNEKTIFVGEGAVHSFDSNQLAANSPCEDHYSFAKCRSTGSWFFGVFDGHGGAECSKAVARRLFDYSAVCLLPLHRQKEFAYSSSTSSSSSKNAAEQGQGGLVEEEEASGLLLEWFSNNNYGVTTTSKIGGWNAERLEILSQRHMANLRRFAAYCVEKHEELANVRTALQKAFTALDEDLTLDALLAHKEGDVNLANLSIVTSGSCACVAKIRGPNLYLANVGDAAAVLGVCNEQGVWTARQITHEHTIDNADEVKRIRSEHPAKEATTILKAGRLLGLLYPLRAFGDVRFKWTATDLHNVIEKPLGAKMVPDGLLTPPYLTAKPEVYYHRLTANDKFLVIASDGLWENLSPDQVVRLVSDHMIGRVTLNPYTPPVNGTVAQVIQDLRVRKRGESKRPLDINATTHLIRYAVGGNASNGSQQYMKLASLLGLAQGQARDYHDDITITVIYFDPSYLAQENQLDQSGFD